MENLKQLKEDLLSIAGGVDCEHEWSVLSKINRILDEAMELKKFNYIVTLEDGKKVEDVIVAERKLTANVLLTKRFIELGHYNFKVEIC